jgi:hypothetical protein
MDNDSGRDPHAQHIIRTFMEAINHIDESEPKIRDLIESRLMDVAGLPGKVKGTVAIGKQLANEIAVIRHHHIVRAFRHLREHLPSDI